MALEKIEIDNEVRSVELDARLRNVRLRGFPKVKIYEGADIEIKNVGSGWLRKNIFTPQPSVYEKGYLDRIRKLAKLFGQKGIDIFHLTQGYDYTATDSESVRTAWTLVPPVVECVPIRFVPGGGLDYSGLIGRELLEAMKRSGHELNPALKDLSFEEYKRFEGRTAVSVPLICDGSHRIHAGLEGENQNVLFIDEPRQGYPYYAAPKPYSGVHVESERPEGGGGDKTHIITSPGHKDLYRLFPSGGIRSGDVRDPIKKH